MGMLLSAVMGLAPTAARCQDYEPPDPVYPLPLFHAHPENGGFYAAGDFILFRQTNPLKNQVVAVRGFNDTFGQVQETMNFLTDLFFNNPGPPVQVGKFFGSGTEALDVHQVSGPNSYQPGFRTTLGWKFQNDLDIEFNWTHLVTKKNSATAAPVGPTLNGGVDNLDSFLFSPVYNYSNNYVGPQNKLIIALLTPGSFFLGPQIQQFLQDHVRLFTALPAWSVVAVCPREMGGLAACRTVFDRFAATTWEPAPQDGIGDLRWFFATRQP